MSESELYEAQGRAHADAKRLRSEISTATNEARRRQRSLTEILRRADTAISNPTSQEPQEAVATAVQTVHDLRFKVPGLVEQLAALADEIYMKTVELRDLEETIRNF